MAAEEAGRWDTVDPRVQWAFNILDNEGAELTPIWRYYLQPLFGGFIGAIFNPIRNYGQRKPLRSAIHMTFLWTALGFYAGLKLREYNLKNTEQEFQIMKHYIMTHPEKFPEPERKKYGDRVVLLPWVPAR